MGEFATLDLIEEVGMPLKYSYKMKTLVLFIKPTNMDSQEKLDREFQTSSFGYHHFVINSDVKISEKETTKKCILKTIKEERCRIRREKIYDQTLFVCTIITFLSTIYLLYEKVNFLQ